MKSDTLAQLLATLGVGQSFSRPRELGGRTLEGVPRFEWTAQDGYQPLEAPRDDCDIESVSDDGSSVVGHCSGIGLARWQTGSTKVTQLAAETPFYRGVSRSTRIVVATATPETVSSWDGTKQLPDIPSSAFLMLGFSDDDRYGFATVEDRTGRLTALRPG